MKDYSYNKLTCNDSIWDTNLLLNISDYCLTNIPDIDFSKDCFPNELSGFTMTTIAENLDYCFPSEKYNDKFLIKIKI